MMAEIDLEPLVEAFVDFFAIFLVTIPQMFLSEALDGGILITVWNTFFGDPAVLSLLLILSFIGGGYYMLLRTTARARTNKGGGRKL